MIQILQSPIENRVVLDGNNTLIKIKSSNGAGHYFRAFIYINDQLFDEQSWSREDNFNATKDLRYLYNAYFKNEFTTAFTNGLELQSNLKKKVSITIKEYLTATDLEVATVTLPEYYILYNAKSEDFNHFNKIKILGLESPVHRISNNGKVVVPFYVNTVNEAINVKIVLDNATEIGNFTIAASTQKEVYLYTFNLPDLAYQILSFKVVITVGATILEKVFKTIRNPSHPITEIIFKNNFGYYIPVYFEGALTVTEGYKGQSYEAFNSEDVLFAIDQTADYKIETGYLLKNENKIVTKVAKALQSFLFYENTYLPINTEIKKTTSFKSSEHLFDEGLSFSFKKGLPIDNNGFVSAIEVTNLEVTGNENTTIEIIYTNEFAIHQFLISQLNANGNLLVVLTNTTESPANLNEPILWADFDKLKYTPEINEFASPYDDFKIKFSNGYFYSDEAEILVNVLDDPNTNTAPVISFTGIANSIIRNQSGNGSTTVNNLTITDPDNDTFTVLIETVGVVAGVTITDETTITPTISVTSATPLNFQVKVTATDVNGNIATLNRTFAVFTISSVMSATPTATNGTQQEYRIDITGGLDGETVDLEFDYDVYGFEKYVSVNSQDLNNEVLVNLYERRKTFTKTYDVNGEITFFINIEDAGTAHETLKITQSRATGNIYIDKSNETIVI